MKNLYLFSFLILFSLQFGFAQEYEVIRETKKIIDSRDIYLNGGARSQFGGKSRTYFQVDLPPNTVQWYYSFTTTEGQSGTNNINLAVQLAGMLSDPTGLTSSTLSAIKVPEGVATADVYLLDQNNMNLFIQKVDANGGSFLQYPEGMVENTKQAVVKIDDIKWGTWYLGIKNPSSVNAININFEVVAITENRIKKEKPENQQKAELYGGLGWSQFENGNYEKCIEYSNKANGEYELGWIIANKALAQLMTEKESEAMETYIYAITLTKKQTNPHYFFREMVMMIL